MKNKIFEYVYVHIPKEEKQKESMIGDFSELVVAKDEKEALIVAARNIPPEFSDRLDEIEIVIRPF